MRSLHLNRYVAGHLILAAGGIGIAYGTGLVAPVLTATIAVGLSLYLAGQLHVRRLDATARQQAEARYRTLVEQLPLITYIDSPYSAESTTASRP